MPVFEFSKSVGYTSFWVGYTDVNADGTFTDYRDDVMTMQQWTATDQNSFNGGNRMTVIKRNGIWTLNDVDDAATFNCMCQKKR